MNFSKGTNLINGLFLLNILAFVARGMKSYIRLLGIVILDDKISNKFRSSLLLNDLGKNEKGFWITFTYMFKHKWGERIWAKGV